MSQWQVLRAGRVSRAALGYHVHRGPLMSVHHSTATTASAAPESSRTFCLSKEKLTLQQLNRRLALYLQQALCLQLTNHRLEHQIKEALNRKCPRELEEMDGHLRTASLLHEQISECLTAQAHMKLQLLDAELTVFNFTAKCKKEREHHECLEMKLSNLRLVEDELKAHKLPELQSLLNSQTQQLAELQMQHQQGMQGLLAQVSGGISLEMQTAESSDLIQQLEDLRQMRMNLLNKNRNKCWFNTQVSMLNSPEMPFDSSVGSKVVQAELEELRTTAASLEEELTQLQAQNILLEASGVEQTESFVLQVLALQQRADSLCREIDSVLQAAAQHTAKHQTLLDIKSHLETEMQEYRRLLVELRQDSHSAYRRQAPLDRTVCVQGGNLRMNEVPRGLISTVGQTPVITPVTIIQLPVTVQLQRKEHSNNSSVMEIKTSDLIESLHMPVKQQTGAQPKMTGRESMTMIDAMINSQSSPVENNVAVVQASKMEINAAKGIIMLVHDETVRDAAVQFQPETFVYNGPTKEIGLQANKTETNIQTEISKTTFGAKAELKEEPCCVKQMATTDPSKQSAVVLKTETDNVILHQPGSVHDKNEDPDQIMCYNLRSTSETVGDPGEVAVTAYKASGSPLCRSNDAPVKISGELTIVGEKDIEVQTVVAERNSFVFRLDQSSALSDKSSIKPDKVLKDEDTRSGTENNAFSGPDSNGNCESKIASTEKKVELVVSKEKNCVHETIEIKVAPTVQYLNNSVGQEALLSTTDSKNSESLTDSGIASSDLEELLSPTEMDVFLSPTKTSETEVLMGLTDQVFCPVDLEDHGSSTNLNLSPKGPEIYLSPNDTEKCLSPVMAEGSPSPKGEEEDKEECLTLTKGKTQVRPVEKCILSTKEEQQSLTFSVEQTLTEGDRSRTVTILVTEGDSLCFGSFEDNESRSRGRNKNTSSVADRKDVHSPGGSYYCKDHKETASMGSGVARHSGSTAASNSGVATGLAANFSGTIANSSGVVSSAESEVTAVVQGRFRHGSREWMVYGGGLGHKSSLHSGTSPTSEGTKEHPSMAIPVRCLPETDRFSRSGSGEWEVYRSSLGSKCSQDAVSSPRKGKGQSLSVVTNLATTNPAQTGRSNKRESRERIVYGGSLQRNPSVDSGFSLPRTETEERTATDILPTSSQQGAERFDRRISGEWMQTTSYLATSPNKEIRMYDNQGSDKLMVCSSSSFSRECKESLPITTNMATSPPGTGRFGSRGSREWRVYGSNAKSEESPSVPSQLATSLLVVPRAGRFGSEGSGDWRYYGGNTRHLSSAGGADRINVSANEGQRIGLPSSYTHRGPRLSSTASGGRLSSGSVVRRSRSVGSSGRLSSSGSGGKLSTSPSSHRISSSGKPIYSSASGSRSSVGHARPPTGGRTTSIQTASGGSSGGSSSSMNGGFRISSTGSMSEVSGSGSKDRISSPASGGFSSSSGSGRASGRGGRVINSSDQLKRSTSCGAKGNKEKISICKMAALSISAAGRERSQERRRLT